MKRRRSDRTMSGIFSWSTVEIRNTSCQSRSPESERCWMFAAIVGKWNIFAAHEVYLLEGKKIEAVLQCILKQTRPTLLNMSSANFSKLPHDGRRSLRVG